MTTPETKRLVMLFGIASIIFILVFTDSCKNTGESGNSLISQDTVSLSKSWELAIPNQPVPEGLQTIRAEECGTCHVAIYNEWEKSIHSIAFQDPQFQSEWKKDGVYVCLNCHTPLQNQQAVIVTGLINGSHKNPVMVPNEEYDEILKYESVTCATCHVRGGMVIGVRGYPGSPHPVKTDPNFLSEQICLTCHNLKEELNPALVCTFETGDEWLKTSKKEEGFNCISCHMPLVRRSISENGKEYESHQHHFPGSGIPKFPDMEPEGLQGLEIIPGQLPEKFVTGDNLRFSLKIKNSYAGHSLPTGDPERFYLIHFTLYDINNEIEDEQLYRIGEQWEWYPVAKKISDNNLKSMEEREFKFVAKLTSPGLFNLNIEITKHRITEENASYNQLSEDYPRFISVFSRTFPIRVRE